MKPERREKLLKANRVKSKELLLLQDVWRKAYRKGDDGLIVRFPSKAGAVRARMQLYNAVKLQKSGADLMDMELVHAAEDIEIIWVDEVTIKLQRRAKSDMMVGLMEAIGTDIDKYVDQDAVEHSNKMLEMLAKEGLAPAKPVPPISELDAFTRDLDNLEKDHKPNPFFDRTKKE